MWPKPLPVGFSSEKGNFFLRSTIECLKLQVVFPGTERNHGAVVVFLMSHFGKNVFLDVSAQVKCANRSLRGSV